MEHVSNIKEAPAVFFFNTFVGLRSSRVVQKDGDPIGRFRDVLNFFPSEDSGRAERRRCNAVKDDTA